MFVGLGGAGFKSRKDKYSLALKPLPLQSPLGLAVTANDDG